MSNPLPSSPKQPKERGDMVGGSPAHHLAAGQVWYLVHCKPNGEQMALRNLENQDFPAFLPLQKLTHRKAPLSRPNYAPCSPAICLSPRSHRRPMAQDQQHAGVARLVPPCRRANPVPPTIMTQLFARCDATGVFQQRDLGRWR